MKILKCYISSFGKLKDVTFDFKDGLNTVKEDNGFGKSTLASFIKAMFYGVSGSNKRSVEENERIKFRPWNSTEKFGGYIIFERGGKNYKIERFFGLKDSEDTIKVIDEQTGKAFLNTDNIGKRIFEIDEDGFLSTTYFSQKDFEIKSNASLTAKFNSLMETDDGDFDKVINRVEEKAKKYKYSGNRGLIPQNKEDLVNVEERIEQAKKSSETVNSLNASIEKLKEEQTALKMKSDLLSEKAIEVSKLDGIKIKKENYKEFSEKRVALKERLDKACDILNGNKPTEIEISDCNKLINAYNSEKETERNICESIDSVPVNQKKQPVKNIVLSILLVSAIFLILGAVLIAFNIVVAIVSFSLAVIGGITGLFLKYFKSSNVNETLKEIKKKDLENVRLQMQKDEDTIKSFLGKFNVNRSDYYNALEMVKNAVLEQKTVSEELGAVIAKLQSLEADKDLNADVSLTDDIEKIRFEKADIDRRLSEKTAEIASIMQRINYNEELVCSLPDLYSKKDELKQKGEEYKREYDLLNLTATYLKKADENLKIKYKAPLQNSVDKYLSLIDDKHNKVNIDVDLNVTVEENGIGTDTDYYSKGYQNLFEICKRFALTEVLFTGEKPFIILDDPFYNLDDKKLACAIDLIKKLSEKYQIIYLVCHESRRA